MDSKDLVWTATGSRAGELPALVSNGCIGLRVREVPLIPGMTIVSGVVGQHPVRRIEAAAGCPYPLAADLFIDGVGLSDQPWEISDITQSYDFSCGELKSEFSFRVREKSIRVEVLTFASRTPPSLVLQEVSIHASAPMQLGVHAKVDTSGLRGSVSSRLTTTPGTDEPVCDGSFVWHTEGDLSQCGIAAVSEFEAPSEVKRSVNAWDEAGPWRPIISAT